MWDLKNEIRVKSSARPDRLSARCEALVEVREDFGPCPLVADFRGSVGEADVDEVIQVTGDRWRVAGGWFGA